jgi:hypothetical protein
VSEAPRLPIAANLHLEIDKHKRLRKELLARWPALAEDAETLSDSLEGISTLPEAIAAVLRSGREDVAVAKALGEQIERMQSRKARLLDRAERKKALALWAMQEANERRIDAPDFIAYLGMSQAKVIIPDETLVPSRFLRVKTEPDKKLIGAALRAGEDVKFASLGNPQPTIIVKDG